MDYRGRGNGSGSNGNGSRAGSPRDRRGQENNGRGGGGGHYGDSRERNHHGNRHGSGSSGSTPRRGGGGGGFRRNASTVVNPERGLERLPMPVTAQSIAKNNFGWNPVPENEDPTPPPALPGGTISSRRIGVTSNNLRTRFSLPEKMYQYDVAIDLSEASKERIRASKAARKADSRNVAQRGRPNMNDGNDEPRPKLWKKIVEYLVTKKLETAHFAATNEEIHIATDLSKSLYTIKPLAISKVAKYDVKLDDLDEEEHGQGEYTCSVQLVSELNLSNLEKYLENTQEWVKKHGEAPEESVHLERIYNIVLKTNPSYKYATVGRASFFPSPKNQGGDLTGGLENWTGFSMIFNVGWRPFVNVDVANSAFIKNQSVYDALSGLFREKNGQNTDKRPNDINTLGSRDLAEATNFLKGFAVEYEMAPGEKRSGRVIEVLEKIASKNTFTKNDQITNVEDYFWHEHKKRLKWPRGICLKVKGRGIIPAEFCKIKKGQSWNKKLNEFQTANFIRQTAKPAPERLENIKRAIREIEFDSDELMKEFGMKVSNTLHSTEARVLPAPTLVYANTNGSGQKWLTAPLDGVWNMWDENLSFVEPYSRGENKIAWGVLKIGRGPHDGDIHKFVTMFTRCAIQVGLKMESVDKTMAKYKKLEWPNDQHRLKSCLTWYKDNGNSFVLVILPGNGNSDIYSQVKITSEVEMNPGILTQCITGKTIEKCQHTCAQNIVQKLNMKLGGTNHILNFDAILQKIDIMKVPALIMGADVTHPGLDSKYPSFAAVTANVSRTGMPFTMSCKAQKKADKGAAEIILGFEEITYRFIEGFITNTGHKPRRIFYFRDGVGEGQFGEVLCYEMLAIRAGCKRVEQDKELLAKCYKDIQLGEKEVKNYEPGITFIAVQKRHKIRIFCKDVKDGVGRSVNVPPGTIVDTQIVSAQMSNFYLVSHSGIQGTSRPTNYQILWDDNDFNLDELQMLTYFLCYCFMRCTRAVSYPCPTYYAHLAATRAKVFANDLNDETLSNIMEVNERIRRNNTFIEEYPMHFI